MHFYHCMGNRCSTFCLASPLMLIVNASRAVSHTASMIGGAASAAHAVTPPTVGSSSSSLSSSLDDQQDFCELIRATDESHQMYSDATYEVGWLELCLDAIKVVLSTLERETYTTQVVTSNA